MEIEAIFVQSPLFLLTEYAKLIRLPVYTAHNHHINILTKCL